MSDSGKSNTSQSNETRSLFDPRIPEILKADDVFSIQVGESLFKISGASLSSDAPSFFTDFFLPYRDEPEENRPVLYIDRSPDVFQLIVQHLRGYYVVPEDEKTYIYLFADAAYFRLPKLQESLKSDTALVRVGSQLFRVAIDVFDSPGNSPNYITLGFTTHFGTQHAPILHKQLIRPMPLIPADVPNRSSTLFRYLLDLLQGVKSAEDLSPALREALIKESRFYRFRGLEQNLIRHKITKNVGINGKYEEITLALQDIRLTGSYMSIQCFTSASGVDSKQLFYKRPFVDNIDRLVVFQIEDNAVRLKLAAGAAGTTTCRAQFLGLASTKLQEVMAKAHADVLFYGSPPSKDDINQMQIVLENADVTVDGKIYDVSRIGVGDDDNEEDAGNESTKKRKRAKEDLASSTEPYPEIILNVSQWRLIINTATNSFSLRLLKAVGHSSKSNTSRTLL